MIPGLGRSFGEGNDNPLQYSCLENPMDRGAWQATVHRVNKESDMTEATEHTGDLCVSSSVNEHLDRVSCLAIMNNAAANVHV